MTTEIPMCPHCGFRHQAECQVNMRGGRGATPTAGRVQAAPVRLPAAPAPVQAAPVQAAPVAPVQAAPEDDLHHAIQGAARIVRWTTRHRDLLGEQADAAEGAARALLRALTDAI